MVQAPFLSILFQFLQLANTSDRLLYRANQVVTTPIDDLVRLLGLEVPPSPTPSLLEITPCGLSLHWKPPELRQTVVKYFVRINGIQGMQPSPGAMPGADLLYVVGDVSAQQTAITIKNLRPNHHYTVRIIAVNSGNFQASSDPIRVKTQAEQSSVHQSENPESSEAHNAETYNPVSVPVIIPYATFNDSPLAANTPTGVTREYSTSYAQPKRTAMLRRASPAYIYDPAENRDNGFESPEGHSGTVYQLTERLDQTRMELRSIEEQEKEEEGEYTKQYNALTARKEELQSQQGKRENESKELKRLVTSLEQANTTAQRKRLIQEKILQQKLAQKGKLQEDAQRWDREVSQMHEEAAQIALHKEDYADSSHQKIQKIRDEQEPDLQEIKSLEEHVRLTGVEMKSLEESKKRDDEATENNLTDYKKAVEAADTAWKMKEIDVRQRYVQASAELQTAQTAYYTAMQRSGYMSNRRLSQATGYGPSYSPENTAVMNDGHIYLPENNTRTLTSAFPNHVDFNNADSGQNLGPVIRNQFDSEAEESNHSPSPYFNTNILTIPSNHASNHLSEHDMLGLTGGALMSPSANNLLPSDLLGDDLEDIGSRIYRAPNDIEMLSPAEETITRSLPTRLNPHATSRSMSRQPSFSQLLPGLGNVPGMKAVENANYVPNSPGSMGSRSPSALSSPQSSLTNLHQRQISDSFVESDRRSIRSVSSTSQAGRPIGRFETFFSGRQRGKTTSDEGPPLGSLKVHQSRSMPRQLEEEGLTADAPSHEPKRLASLGSRLRFGNATTSRRHISLSNLGDATTPPSDNPASTRLRSLGFFGSRGLSWRGQATGGEVERSSSPRPASTYSLDNALPPPEAGQQYFGWDNAAGGQTRDTPSPWLALATSRRPSIHQEFGERPLHDMRELEENSQELAPLEENVPQAPIGTRPVREEEGANSHRKSGMAYFKLSIRDKKADKSPTKSGKRAEGEEHFISSGDGPSSPPESYHSKVHALDSAAESLENLAGVAVEGGLSPQESNVQPGSASKESFMRKIQRKGSSSRFSLPSFKEKGGIFSRKTHADDGEDDSAGGSGSMASPSLEKRSGFSLPSLRKRGKKGPDAPSISETSMTSETGDENESRTSVDV